MSHKSGCVCGVSFVEGKTEARVNSITVGSRKWSFRVVKEVSVCICGKSVMEKMLT